jgi:hypothetical protein
MQARPGHQWLGDAEEMPRAQLLVIGSSRQDTDDLNISQLNRSIWWHSLLCVLSPLHLEIFTRAEAAPAAVSHAAVVAPAGLKLLLPYNDTEAVNGGYWRTDFTDFR